MVAPSDPLVAGQEPGSLGLEEQKALAEGRAVVVGGGGEGDETEQKQGSSHGNSETGMDLGNVGNGVAF